MGAEYMGSHSQISVTCRLVRLSCAQESLPDMRWLNPLPPWKGPGPVRLLFLVSLCSLILGALSETDVKKIRQSDSISIDCIESTCTVTGHELIGAGGCRGDGWSEGSWPVTAGKQSRESCSALCQVQEGCTSFSLSKSEDCFLFGHDDITAVKSLGGECYKIIKSADGNAEDNEQPKKAAKPAPSPPKQESKPAKSVEKPKKVEKASEPESVDGKFVVEVGLGGCRGKNWNQPPYPVNQGRLSKANCAKVCLKSECSAFHMLHPEDDGTAECFLYGHEELIPVKGLGGTCYTLSDKAPSAAGSDDDDDDEEQQVLDGPVHMAMLGKGRCRGQGWTFKKWPVLKGFLSPRQCAEECAKKKGCSAFDLSELQADNTFDCALYGHKKVEPASAVNGNCYILSEKEGVVPGGLSTVVDAEDDEEEEEQEITGPVHMAMLGKGRCRGSEWTSKKWPVLKGFLSPRQCAEECAKKKGCSAFDLSELQEDNTFDCALYGHKKVAPASAVHGNCYILSDKEGVVPGGLSTVVEAEDEEDEEENEVSGDVDFHQVGKGRCRGSGWTHKKWPVIRGHLGPQDCAVACAKKKGCTAFDVAPMPEGLEECAIYGHKKVLPATGVPGDCYLLGKSDEEPEIDNEPEVEEVDDGVTHKFKHLGHGVCRGAKWTDKKWPVLRGMKTLQQCANSCGRKKGCTSFDISKEDGKNFDCMLYGHKNPIPAPGVPGECYSLPGAAYVEETHEVEDTPSRRPSILDEDDEDYTNIQNVELLGKGACRGIGWQDGQWPLAQGRKTLGDCADTCKKTSGCIAFDLSNKDGDKYDCLLLGHPGVLPASALAAKCYVIKGAKPVKATLMDNSKSAKKADDSYPSGGDGYSKIGSGLCRGPGWTLNGFPKDAGVKSIDECAASCQKSKGCKAFDISNQEGKKFTCLLFGHTDIVPAASQSLSGACYSIGSSNIAVEESVDEIEESKEEEEEEMVIDIEGDVDVALVGKGGCRGGGWQAKGWPKVKGFATIDDCGRMCVGTNGCSAFHSASPKEGTDDEFECFLFGHKSVIPAIGLIGDCYTVSKGSVGGSKLVKSQRKASAKPQKKKTYKIPEFEEPTVVEDTYDDEDDEDWLFDPPPPEIRSREHIAEILGLNEPAKESILKITETTLKDLKKVYETSIKSLEKEYKYKELSNRHFGDPEMFNKPLIVLMGPWSGGKSTMMNYLLGTEYTKNAFRSTAEPSPGFNFNIAMYGEREEEVDGTEMSAEWAFSSLQKFGQEFLKKLRGKKMPNKLLERATFAEIPGVLETGTIRKIDRRYPFNDACQWFIDHADLIILVYDYAKLDIGPETEALLDQLKGRESQVRILLNKADEITAEELLKIQGNLVWNVSPLMASVEPPTMYASSMWSKPYRAGAPKRLLKSQEMSLLKDIKDAIDRRVENRIATARRFAVRVRNHAKMVDCYLTTYKNNKGIFGDKKKVAQDILDNPSKYHIYEGLSTLTNISRYDLPDPDTYRDFFNVHPLYDFPTLQSTCTFFKGCPLNKLDISIAYELPDILTNFKRKIHLSLNPPPEPKKIEVPKGKSVKSK